MVPPRFQVDLDRPAELRWDGIEAFRHQAGQLLDYYVRDLGGLDEFGDLLSAYRDAFVAPAHVAEMRALARRLGRTEGEILLCNLYYDALKHVLGCTAFAIDTDDGPLHARNLDWDTANGMLGRFTLMTEYRRGGAVHFVVVGWPGYAGALSGVAPGRFAVSLNAVLSAEPAALAPPVTFLIRDVLDTARDFEEAVSRLSNTPVTSDSLLLVTGTRRGEMVVIERSPTRAAVRGAEAGLVAVTNDYRALASEAGARVDHELADTSCDRFDRAVALARARRPASPADCLAILADGRVRMNITVQSMVLSASSGLAEVRIPARFVGGGRDGA